MLAWEVASAGADGCGGYEQLAKDTNTGTGPNTGANYAEHFRRLRQRRLSGASHSTTNHRAVSQDAHGGTWMRVGSKKTG